MHKALSSALKVIASLLIALSPLSASAMLAAYPVVFDGDSGVVMYDPEDNQFKAYSSPTTLTMNGTDYAISSGDFSLEAMINDGGALGDGDNIFSLTGYLEGMNGMDVMVNNLNGGNTLLEGTVDAVMAYSNGTSAFFFDVTNVEGMLVENGIFPTHGAVHIELATAPFPGWEDFSCSDCGAKISIGVPVPEPATLALLSLGLAGLGFKRCRMKA